MPNNPVLLSPGHESEAVHMVGHRILRQSLHKYPIDFALVDIQCFGFGHILQQIVNFLVVNLQERTEYLEFGLLRVIHLVLPDSFE